METCRHVRANKGMGRAELEPSRKNNQFYRVRKGQMSRHRRAKKKSSPQPELLSMLSKFIFLYFFLMERKKKNFLFFFFTKKLGDKPKDFDEKYDISSKVEQVRNNEKMQCVCNKVAEFAYTEWNLLGQLVTETKQVYFLFCFGDGR
ncbi:hypothetical protein RFI_37685 [Reticulomyxa filosa]|uniref:Uncharacterized protein n=1 Tax=Reticulomyxa filosa TaxID=46433 RepID=X6LCN0_RETFI|nr:hypothetical protein RFI_37685 [Reticulomyxa filosa]|eukprot:ETN99782.1 hypothetical protein RFI_37685 [Reticulomyxa filosa]